MNASTSVKPGNTIKTDHVSAAVVTGEHVAGVREALQGFLNKMLSESPISINRLYHLKQPCVGALGMASDALMTCSSSRLSRLVATWIGWPWYNFSKVMVTFLLLWLCTQVDSINSIRWAICWSSSLPDMLPKCYFLQKPSWDKLHWIGHLRGAVFAET